MYIDPFCLLKSVLNVHPENWYTTDEFSGGSVVFIHAISRYVKYVYFQIIVKTGGGTKVQVRDQKTFMNLNNFLDLL